MQDLRPRGRDVVLQSWTAPAPVAARSSVARSRRGLARDVARVRNVILVTMVVNEKARRETGALRCGLIRPHPSALFASVQEVAHSGDMARTSGEVS